MRLVGLAAAFLAVALPAAAQPEPVEPGPPADEAAMARDVRFVILQLEALARAQAERAAAPMIEAPDPRLTRTTASGSRLLRPDGAGASNVRVSRGCPSLSCTRTY